MGKRYERASKMGSLPRWLGPAIALGFLGFWGCANQAKCDPGFELQGARCAPVPAAPPEEPVGGAGAGGAPPESDSPDASAPGGGEPGAE